MQPIFIVVGVRQCERTIHILLGCFLVEFNTQDLERIMFQIEFYLVFGK